MDFSFKNTLQKIDSRVLEPLLSQQVDEPNKKISKVSAVGINERDHINEYVGWKVPSNNFKVPKVEADDFSPESFYEKYVSQRRPVIIKGGLSDVSGLDKWKSNEYLKDQAGDEEVMVERRPSDGESFGRGNEISMRFETFLELVHQGDEMHYLTTQDVESNEDGRPDLMAPFMKTLQKCFPLRPKLMGNLVPQNINLWMGNSVDGASSGLHHDYHDNLYIVLRGRKRFRLYSPIDTEKMYTRGTLVQVHPNGRINYKGDETTAYGSDLRSDAAAKASKGKEIAERMLEEAEAAVSEGKPGAQGLLEKAEEELDAAMDALIDAEMDSDDEEGDGGLFGDEDVNHEADFVKEDIEIETGTSDIEDEHITKKRRLVDKTVKNPDNFSRIEPRLLDDLQHLKGKYPSFLNANAAYGDVENGDILYLPASWFHEVTSFGGNNGHLAMNYWFHPPDSKNDFSSPYTSDFWPNDFARRLEDDKHTKKHDNV